MAGKTLDIDAVSYPTSIPDYVGSYMFETLLYGVYVVLFSFCVYLLLHNKQKSKWLFLMAMILFAITTADTGMTVHYAFAYVLPGKKPPAYHAYPKYVFYITNNAIADCMLLFRCYVLWHYNKLVVVVPCGVLLFTTACGYLFVISRCGRVKDLLPLYLWTTFSLNLFLNVLIAGKIFANIRRVRSILGAEMTARSYSFSAIMIESGVIYSIYLLLDLVVPIIIFDAGLIQIVGIVPTLIIIQTGLRGLVRDHETTSTLHSVEVRQSSTPILDSIYSSTELPTTGTDDNVQRSSCVESNSTV